MNPLSAATHEGPSNQIVSTSFHDTRKVQKKRQRSFLQGNDTGDEAEDGLPSDILSDGRPRNFNTSRKRVAIACETCRSRKSRCDAAKPTCSFCSDLGIDCKYRRVTVPDSSEPEVRAGQIFEILNRLGAIEEVLLSSHRGSEATLNSLNTTPESISGIVLSAQILDDHAHTWDANQPLVFSGQRFAEENLLPKVAPERPILPLLGLRFPGLSRLAGCCTPEPLRDLCIDDTESFIELETAQGHCMFSGQSPLNEADLSSRTCWRLQQAFVRNLLPWTPIFSESYCMELVSDAEGSGFNDQGLKTALAFFVFALGAFSVAEDHIEDDSGGFPGLQYFQPACRVLQQHQELHNSLLAVQCHILETTYLLLSLRTYQAWSPLSAASRGVISLLHLKTRINNDKTFKEACYRACWTCYILECELKAYIGCVTQSLSDLQESIPLPSSDDDETGIYWFLSEIALRKLLMSVQRESNFEVSTIYAPIVVSELRTQLSQWYSNLPNGIKFPLDAKISILDPCKAFLRGQYFSISFMIHWPSIVRLATIDDMEVTERERLIIEGRECLTWAVNYIYSIEKVCLGRHLMLFSHFAGLNCISHAMLVSIQIPQLKVPGSLEALHKAVGIFDLWSDNPGVAALRDKLQSQVLRVAFDKHR